MAAKATDIRITKTQRALSIAMLSLLEKNSFQKITVNDICQEALVSRSTFYAHFVDKYMLLQFCMQELGARMRVSTAGLPHEERIRASLQAIADHSGIFHNIFLADPNKELVDMLRGHFTGLLSDMLRETDTEGRLQGNRADLVATYCAGGMSAMVSWWIEGDFKVAIDEVAECQLTLLKGTLGSYLGPKA